MIKIPVYLRDMYDAKHLSTGCIWLQEGCRPDLWKIYCRCKIHAGCVQSYLHLIRWNLE